MNGRRKLHRMVTVNGMQFSSMPEKGTIDPVFSMRRLQEEYRAIGKKLYMFFMDLVTAFDRVPQKALEWAIRKEGVP